MRQGVPPATNGLSQELDKIAMIAGFSVEAIVGALAKVNQDTGLIIFGKG